MAPACLSLSEVLEIHQDQVARYGGASGIRDMDLLKSALGMPSATYDGRFLHTGIHEMAFNQILTKNSFDNNKISAYLDRFYKALGGTAGLFVYDLWRKRSRTR